ncbi:MAG: ATP-binding protein [Desulfococcaceae bacterium]
MNESFAQRDPHARIAALRHQCQAAEERALEAEARLLALTEERDRLNRRLEALAALNRMNGATAHEISEFVLRQALRLTDSPVGITSYVFEERNLLLPVSWSPGLEETCFAPVPAHQRIDVNGIWRDVVERKAPAIWNRYGNDVRLPEGHIPMHRLMAVPMMENGRCVMIAALANKETDYETGDADLVADLLKGMWNRIRAIEIHAELKESEQKFRSLFEFFPQPVVLLDLETNALTEANEIFCRTFRLEHSGIIGRTLNDLGLLREEDHARFFQEIRRPEGVQAMEVNLRTGCDQPLVMLLYARFIWTAGHSSVLVIFADITELKRLQQRVEESRKTEAIIKLAGGIAHEFNNALFAITGNLELLGMEIGDKGRSPRYLKAMNQSAQRMIDLTNKLLAYSQSGQFAPMPVQLGAFIRRNMPLMLASVPSGIQVESRFPDPLPPVKADPAQLQAVLSALFSNAVEAIEGTGRVIVSALSESVEAPDSDLSPGPYAVISVCDTGRGMDEEKQRKIFDPFFTTKFQGRGLGMAAVFGIVKNHGGGIRIFSSPDRGTEVRVYLPAQVGADEQPPAGGGGTMEPGTGAILVIEDEEMVLDISRAVLRKLNYQVVEARSGLEAVSIAREHDGPLDAALLDVGLPDVDGGQIFPLLKEARPHMKVIVCSGCSLEGPARQLLRDGAEGFIQKPFTLSALSETLKSALTPKGDANEPSSTA